MWHFDIVLVLAMIGTGVLVCMAATALILTAGFPVWFYRNHWRYSHPSLVGGAIGAFLFFVAVTSGLVGACDAVFYFWSH